jgi:hypothetical protein
VKALEDQRTPSVTFAGRQTFFVGMEVFAVAVGDFNSHNRPDIAVVNYFSGRRCC